MEYLGLHALDRPLAVVNGKSETKYIMNTTISKIISDHIIIFLTQISEAKISPEPIEKH